MQHMTFRLKEGRGQVNYLAQAQYCFTMFFNQDLKLEMITSLCRQIVIADSGFTSQAAAVSFTPLKISSHWHVIWEWKSDCRKLEENNT